MAITPGSVAFSLPVQRRNPPNSGDSSAFPFLKEPARGARPAKGRFEPEWQSQVVLRSRDGF